MWPPEVPTTLIVHDSRRCFMMEIQRWRRREGHCSGKGQPGHRIPTRDSPNSAAQTLSWKRAVKESGMKVNDSWRNQQLPLMGGDSREEKAESRQQISKRDSMGLGAGGHYWKRTGVGWREEDARGRATGENQVTWTALLVSSRVEPGWRKVWGWENMHPRV